MWYIWYSQATMCKNLPDEEIQQQISSEYPVKSFLMELLSLYNQSQQISPQPERMQNLTIKKLLSHYQVTNKKLSYHINTNLMWSEPLLCNRPLTALCWRQKRLYSTFSKWPTWRTIILFYNTLIMFLYMFQATSCSSSGGQIVLIKHLVPSLSVSGRPVHRRMATYYKIKELCIKLVIY